MAERHTETGAFKEIPRVERFVARPGLSRIFAGIKDKKEGDHALYRAYIKHGYTLSEIGDFLGIHYSTVSKAVKEIEEAEKKRNSKITT